MVSGGQRLASWTMPPCFLVVTVWRSVTQSRAGLPLTTYWRAASGMFDVLDGERRSPAENASSLLRGGGRSRLRPNQAKQDSALVRG